jgi:hypothetical protein
MPPRALQPVHQQANEETHQQTRQDTHQRMRPLVRPLKVMVHQAAMDRPVIAPAVGATAAVASVVATACATAPRAPWQPTASVGRSLRTHRAHPPPWQKRCLLWSCRASLIPSPLPTRAWRC